MLFLAFLKKLYLPLRNFLPFPLSRPLKNVKYRPLKKKALYDTGRRFKNGRNNDYFYYKLK